MFRELARQARTIRRFDESRPVTREDLRQLVDIARICPCGGNQQPLRYRLVADRDECARVFPHTAWAAALKDWPGPAEGERPTGYIVIVSEGEHGTDVGIAAQTIQLAAAEMGIGCCMLGSIRRPKIQEELKIPANYTIDLLIALGRPAETVVLEDAGDDLRYYRTADQVHHVPKLPLDRVIIA